MGGREGRAHAVFRAGLSGRDPWDPLPQPHPHSFTAVSWTLLCLSPGSEPSVTHTEAQLGGPGPPACRRDHRAGCGRRSLWIVTRMRSSERLRPAAPPGSQGSQGSLSFRLGQKTSELLGVLHGQYTSGPGSLPVLVSPSCSHLYVSHWSGP